MPLPPETAGDGALHSFAWMEPGQCGHGGLAGKLRLLPSPFFKQNGSSKQTPVKIAGRRLLSWIVRLVGLFAKAPLTAAERGNAQQVQFSEPSREQSLSCWIAACFAARESSEPAEEKQPWEYYTLRLYLTNGASSLERLYYRKSAGVESCYPKTGYLRVGNSVSSKLS